eukprot:m.906415 g.906415  ORF g.906415 m.906415 type:complete len:185 (-) comp23704_c0_seq13:288-842(-)
MSSSDDEEILDWRNPVRPQHVSDDDDDDELPTAFTAASNEKLASAEVFVKSSTFEKRKSALEEDDNRDVQLPSGVRRSSRDRKPSAACLAAVDHDRRCQQETEAANDAQLEKKRRRLLAQTATDTFSAVDLLKKQPSRLEQNRVKSGLENGTRVSSTVGTKRWKCLRLSCLRFLSVQCCLCHLS